jgi:hypothetical protein
MMRRTGVGQKLDATPGVRATVRAKVQPLFLFAFLAFAAPAGAAEYTVQSCAGQPASASGWAGFIGGTHPSKVGPENCASAGGSMPAVLTGTTSPPAGTAGWQVFAPANTTVAGATFYRKVAVAGTGYGFVARGVTPGAASTYPTIESCSGPTGCAAIIKRTSFAWRSPRADVNRLQAYVRCVPTCQNLTAAEAASVRISRVDIALTDASAPTVSSGPTSAMFDAGAAASGVQSIDVGFKDTGGGIAATGVQVDGQTVSEVPVANSACRTPYRRLVPCPLTVATTLQFNPAAVPDGPHQVRVFARDATGANVGYSASFAVITSARGAINGTNGSDQVKLSVGARRPVRAGHHAPRTRSTVTVSYGSKAVVSGRLVNSAGQPVVGARLAVAAAVDRGAPSFGDLPANVVTDAKGAYKLTIPAGPSLRVRVSYFARALDTLAVARADARVKVRTKATLRAARRHLGSHRRAIFRGRVYGLYRPPGVRVELQGRRGRSYVTLATAATRPDGSYRLSYRFTRRAHGRYVFRLRVRHYARFPYFLGYSPAANVFVG